MPRKADAETKVPPHYIAPWAGRPDPPSPAELERAKRDADLHREAHERAAEVRATIAKIDRVYPAGAPGPEHNETVARTYSSEPLPQFQSSYWVEPTPAEQRDALAEELAELDARIAIEPAPAAGGEQLTTAPFDDQEQKPVDRLVLARSPGYPVYFDELGIEGTERGQVERDPQLQAIISGITQALDSFNRVVADRLPQATGKHLLAPTFNGESHPREAAGPVLDAMLPRFRACMDAADVAALYLADAYAAVGLPIPAELRRSRRVPRLAPPSPAE